MQTIIVDLAKELGVSPLTVTVAIPLIALGANAIARAIPDTATGPLRIVRLIAKTIGLHIKDNTGVAAVLTHKGAVRLDSPDMVPEGVDLAQPELLLDERFRPDPFVRGAKKIQEREP